MASQGFDGAPLVIEAVFKTQSMRSLLSDPGWTWDGPSRWRLPAAMLGGWALPLVMPRCKHSLQGGESLLQEAASQGGDRFEEPAGQFYDQ